MRPTIDGLNADQWFAVARIGATALLIGATLWMAARYCARAVRFIRDQWMAERARREAHEHWLAERRRLSTAGDAYLRENRAPIRVIPGAVHNNDD